LYIIVCFYLSFSSYSTYAFKYSFYVSFRIFIFVLYFVYSVFFVLFCALFLLLCIAVSFLFSYKSTDNCHRVETELQ
jgi:hypothetical protein